MRIIPHKPSSQLPTLRDLGCAQIPHQYLAGAEGRGNDTGYWDRGGGMIAVRSVVNCTQRIGYDRIGKERTGKDGTGQGRARYHTGK